MLEGMNPRQLRISPALVVASVALAVALSGPALAVVDALAPGSVGTTQLKDGAVTKRKIATGAVTSAKVANGSLTRSDIAPAGRLPRARVGTNVNVLSLGEVFVVVSSVQLPPGRWEVTAKNVVNGQYYINCRLRIDATTLDESEAWHGTGTQFVLPVETVVTLAATSTVYSECWGPGDQIYDHDMHAVEVAPAS
jgi:hypothetical protein